jgi:hypothetical protein
MFRKLLVGLAVTVVVLGTQVETAKAEVKVLTSATGGGVLPGYSVKPGVIKPVVGYYPAYPSYPAVYPTYPAYYYPTPVYTPVVPVISVVKYTVLYKASVYHPFAVYGSYSSHALAHGVADSLTASGYIATVGH